MSVKIFYRSVALLFGLSVFAVAWGQADSLYVRLDSTVVSAYRQSSPLVSVGALTSRVGMQGLQQMPALLGNSDPIRFLSMLPGVATGGEMDSGIRIQGGESYHTIVSVEGAPVYGARHLLGLFSVFNPSHYQSMDYSVRSLRSNRLGGSIDMSLPDAIPQRTEFDFNLGILALQGTLRQKVGRHSAIIVSGRRSYLDLFLEGKIRVVDSPLSYVFDDYNFSFISSLPDGSRLTVDAYHGSDRGGYTMKDGGVRLAVNTSWENTVASVNWRNDRTSQKLYYSGFSLDTYVGFLTIDAAMPSGIGTVGYIGTFRAGKFDLGADIAWHRAVPQYPELYMTSREPPGEKEVQTALESTFSVGRSLGLSQGVTADLTLRGTHYLSPERESLWGVMPDVTIRWNRYEKGNYTFSAGMQKQHLFQTGVTDMGLPNEFWFLAGEHSAPQRSAYVNAGYELSFASEMFSLKAEAYYRYLWNQIEYKGDIFDFVNTVYDFDNMLMKGSGRSYGAEIMLHKKAGRLTGWMAYAFGRSLRKFDEPDYSGMYPSSHERLHELNMTATWNSPKWTLGLSLVAASGTPFTAPDSFYVISEKVVCHYGRHNANRLAPYFRMDASFNYYFRKDSRRESGLNFSVYNLTMYPNQLFCRMSAKDGKFAYESVTLDFFMIPSIGYFYRMK